MTSHQQKEFDGGRSCVKRGSVWRVENEELDQRVGLRYGGLLKMCLSAEGREHFRI